MKGTALFALLCTSALLATDQGSQLFVGYERLNISSTAVIESMNGNGITVGANYVVPLKILGDGKNDGLETGVGIDLAFGALDNVVKSAYTRANPKLFIGYHNRNFNVRGNIGYGMLRYGGNSTTLDGVMYGATAGYYFTKSFGMQVSYNTGRLTTSQSFKTDVSYVQINFVWKR